MLSIFRFFCGKATSEMDEKVIIFSTTLPKWRFSKNRVLVVCISFLFLTFFLLANDSRSTLYSGRHDLLYTNRNRDEEVNDSKQVTVADISCKELTINHGCYQVAQDEHRPRFKLLNLTELQRLLNEGKGLV